MPSHARTAVSAVALACLPCALHAADDTLLGQLLFPADSPWHQPITNAPVASTSTAIMANIGATAFRPAPFQDVGTHVPLNDIPYNVAHSSTQAKVTFVIDSYAGESDILAAPLPANIQIEGDYMDGPNPVTGYGTGGRGDSHLVIWDQDTNIDYEFFQAVRPGELDSNTGTTDPVNWHAAGEAVWDMSRNSFRPIGWTSVNAAGTPLLAAMMRPDEGLPVAQGGQGIITHPITVTLANANVLDQFIFPASHHANPGQTDAANEPPMGARFRLKATVDISGFYPQSKIIAQAMKDYGLILTDNGSIALTLFADDSKDTNNNKTLTWNQSDTMDFVHGLRALSTSDLEVVDLTPRVDGVSPDHGAAGDTVTVLGQNFSGAAGRLAVLFGGSSGALGTLATGIAVVDDGHVTAVVPAGVSGSVDVRVISGVYGASADDVEGAGANSYNVMGAALPGGGPIWGYGISAIRSADAFAITAGTASTGSGSGSGSASGTTTAVGGGGGSGGGGGGGCGLGGSVLLLAAVARWAASCARWPRARCRLP